MLSGSLIFSLWQRLRHDKASITLRIFMGDSERIPPAAMRFNSVLQADVPKGRDGKHKAIITQLLSDIEQLSVGSALKIPLAELPDTKENIRSALSRAANQRNLDIATSSNEDFLYVWKTGPKESFEPA
jgi:hypothetical protein